MWRLWNQERAVTIRFCFQVVFLALSYATLYLIYIRFRNTFDSVNDTFRVEFLLVPVVGLSFLENYAFTPLEVKTGREPMVKLNSAEIWLRSELDCQFAAGLSLTLSFLVAPPRSCGPSPSSWRQWP